MSKPTPNRISDFDGVASVAAGSYHSLAVKRDGTVWAWGDNDYRQLGSGSSSTDYNVPVQASSLTGIISISAGGYHSLALKNDGTLLVFGYNSYGQLGNGTNSVSFVPEQLTGTCLVLLTGINEITEGATVTVYPNPFTTSTILHTDKILSAATLTVYNSIGQEVKQIINISGQTVTISRDNLPSGLYFLRLRQDNKVITTDKLVITD